MRRFIAFCLFFVFFEFLFCTFVASAPSKNVPPTSAPPRNTKGEIPPEFVCPPGFSQKEHECILTVKQKPDYYCPAGFEKTDHSGKCMRIVTKPPAVFCPQGSEMVRGVCVTYVDEMPEVKCPPSYQFNGEYCTRSVVMNAGMRCADGYTFTDNLCIRQSLLRATEECLEGYLLDPTAGRCVQRQIEATINVCDDGSMPEEDGTCKSNITSPPIAGCPEGYEPAGGGCASSAPRNNLPPQPRCSNGGTLSGNDICRTERYLDATLECDEGYTIGASGLCEQTLTHPPRPVCTEEFTYNEATGRCESVDAYLADYYCPDGTVMTNNSCAVMISDSVLFSCPDGFTFDQTAMTCVKPDSRMATPTCPADYTLQDGQCVKSNFQPKSLRCPDGYELRASQCVAEESLPPDMHCPAEFALRGIQCVNLRNVEPELVCADGAQLDGNICIRPVPKRPKEKCKLPYVINPHTGHCEDKELAAPQPKCPSGFQLDKHGGSAICIRYDTRAAIPQCPPGTKYDQYYSVCKKICVDVPAASTSTVIYQPATHAVSEVSYTPTVCQHQPAPPPPQKYISTPASSHTTIAHTFSANY